MVREKVTGEPVPDSAKVVLILAGLHRGARVHPRSEDLMYDQEQFGGAIHDMISRLASRMSGARSPTTPRTKTPRRTKRSSTRKRVNRS